jgi:N-acetylmuramoyl-L-alanine amidase
MSKYLWLLDNGHGGIRNGKYETEGKRSPTFEDGRTLYEGEFNRAIVNRIAEMLEFSGIKYVKICPQDGDMALAQRTLVVNSFCTDNDCILISVHSNYADGEGSASGVEVFTTRGKTKSDKVAEVFMNTWKTAHPSVKLRVDYSDNDMDKEADFYVLKYAKCPAILTENFFMDNEKECRQWLMSPEGRDKIAVIHYQTIATIEAIGLENL